jgi:hypothetical protein
MVSLTALWLPIVVSAVVVFVASSLVWMVLPHHRSDWKGLRDQKGMIAELERQGWDGGQFVFPYAGNPPKRDADWQRQCKEGPAGMLVLYPRGGVNMGKSLALWFILCLVLALFVAYLTGLTVPVGAPYLRVFRIAGTAAVLAWAGALPGGAIWFGRSWSSTLKEVVDGIVYGLLVAGVFGWLWPR